MPRSGASPKAEFRRLTGTWRRPDGGFSIIEGAHIKDLGGGSTSSGEPAHGRLEYSEQVLGDNRKVIKTFTLKEQEFFFEFDLEWELGPKDALQTPPRGHAYHPHRNILGPMGESPSLNWLAEKDWSPRRIRWFQESKIVDGKKKKGRDDIFWVKWSDKILVKRPGKKDQKLSLGFIDQNVKAFTEQINSWMQEYAEIIEVLFSSPPFNSIF